MDHPRGNSQGSGTHVLVLDVFQELQFAVGPLRQHGRTEGFHDLLHRDCDACELVLCRTVGPILSLTDKWEEMITNHTRPNAPTNGRKLEQETIR